MKDSTQNRKKKILALFLSAMMAVSVASLAACKGNGGNTSSESSSDTTTETETTITDKGPIKNAGFEVFDTNDGLNVIGTSVSSWGNKPSLFSDGTSSAPASKADSGIIDTSDKAWKDLTGTKLVDENGKELSVEAADELIGALSEDDAIAMWDNLTTRDKLKYYEVWKDANENGKISKDFEKYQKFSSNIGSDGLNLTKIPDTVNPGTHHSPEEKAAADFSDYNVLMIHNKNPESDEGEKVVQSIGSAQKYTSASTVTVQAGAAAEISVWVKTQDLMSSSSDGKAQEAVDKGAYITLSQTVGGTTLPAYEVKNINTENMDLEDTNGWMQYTFLVKGSSYANTTLSLSLGLGQGTSTNRMELVNGYAFFDDIQCNVFSQELFDEKVSEYKTERKVIDAASFEYTKELKTIDLSKEYNDQAFANAETLGYVAGQGFDVFPINLYGELFENVDGELKDADGNFTDKNENGEWDAGVLTEINVSNLADLATKNDDGYTSMADNNPIPTLEGGRNGDADVIDVFENLAAINNYNSDNADKEKFVSAVYDKYLKDVEYPGTDNPVLLMLSARGVAYTVKSDYNFSFDNDTKYMAVSFFVRTSDMSGATGAGITLLHGDEEYAFSSIDTTNVTPVNIGLEDTDGYQEDIYDGWQKCIFFVKNDSSNETASFNLQFSFGPTSIDENSLLSSFQPGFAAFTNFQVLEMSEEAYNSATADTYTKLVTLTDKKEATAAGNSGFDTAGNRSNTHADIKDGIALTKNYKGVYSNSDYVTDKFTGNTAINTYRNAGLLNRNYFVGTEDNESYFANEDVVNTPWMKGIKTIAGLADDAKAADVWAAAFGDATQPLFIWNDGSDSTNSYGFIGANTTISANTTTAVSMRIKTDAVANIYLIDTSDDSRANTLSIGTNVTYWYDAKGDVYTGDPTERGSQKAFILQDNGLYIANTKWDGYDAATMAGKYYANLNAYTDTDENGNKLVAANGGVHGYVSSSDYVKVNGEKRAIAFYNKDGVYYADKAQTIPVVDFSATDLEPRTDAANNKALHATVSATDDWVTVTFYIKAGSTDKNYRLEIWSGDRTGNPNAAGTYVMVDGNPSAVTNASADYDKILAAYEDYKPEEGENITVKQFKSVFSYYDTDKYLRYNKDLDTDNVGDLYKKTYDGMLSDPTTVPTEETIYLYVGAQTENQRYLINYATQDQTVPAAESDKEEPTPDSSSDDTATDSGMNPWLLASSIAIAVVLVLAVLSIVFRKVWKKVRKNVATKTRKPKKSKAKTVKVKTVKAEEPTEEIDEDSPYND